MQQAPRHGARRPLDLFLFGRCRRRGVPWPGMPAARLRAALAIAANATLFWVHAFLARAFCPRLAGEAVMALALVEEGALAIAQAFEIARLVTSLETKQPR